jgi:hypothetical protein
MTAEKQLFVHNVETKIVFLTEVSGQISDGQWENATPRNHWEAWCLRPEQVVVVDDIGKIGRNFYASKDNYGLTSKQLWDIVADRVLMTVNVYELLGEQVLDFICSQTISIPEDVAEYDRIHESAMHLDEYYLKKLTLLEGAGITREIIEEASKHKFYDRPDLINDMKFLKMAFQNFDPTLGH